MAIAIGVFHGWLTMLGHRVGCGKRLCPLQSFCQIRRAFPIFAVRCVAAPTAAARCNPIMHWPLHVAMLQGLGRVVDPTAADGAPYAQAPNEREDEAENLG